MHYIVLYKKKDTNSDLFPWQEHLGHPEEVIEFIHVLGDNYQTKILKEITYETLIQIADGDVEED